MIRWQEFLRSFKDLSESQMTLPAREGGWSIKDILVHVRAWEEEALKYLPTILENQRLPRYKDLYGGINAFNAMTHETNKDLPLKTVLANLLETHQRCSPTFNRFPRSTSPAVPASFAGSPPILTITTPSILK
jgi:hypothetical protein